MHVYWNEKGKKIVNDVEEKMEKFEIKSPYRLLDEDIDLDEVITEDLEKIEPQEQAIAEMKDFCDWLEEQAELTYDSPKEKLGFEDTIEQLKQRGLWVK